MTERRPQRMCVGCRRVQDMAGLIRLYRTVEGSVEADLGGHAGGRGAYLCPDERCLAEALKRRRLGQAFRAPVTIGPATRERLQALVAARRGGGPGRGEGDPAGV